DAHWLSCLVWPGEGNRAQRLEAAIASARRDPPAVHRGDMLTGLPSLVAQVPADATLVIYHTSALWYLPAERPDDFPSPVPGPDEVDIEFAAWLAEAYRVGAQEHLRRSSAGQTQDEKVQ